MRPIHLRSTLVVETTAMMRGKIKIFRYIETSVKTPSTGTLRKKFSFFAYDKADASFVHMEIKVVRCCDKNFSHSNLEWNSATFMFILLSSIRTLLLGSMLLRWILTVKLSRSYPNGMLVLSIKNFVSKNFLVFSTYLRKIWRAPCRYQPRKHKTQKVFSSFSYTI